MEDKPKSTRLERWKNRFRIVVLNDSTFEERLSFTLTPLNVFVFVGSTIILLITLVILLIAFTPLREYIPGYADVNMRKELVNVLIKTDSLESELAMKRNYLQNIYNIISDSVPEGNERNIRTDSTKNYQALDFTPSKEDSLLREEIESRDPYSLNVSETGTRSSAISSFLFFTPLQGLVSSSFNASNEHYGVDIVANENEAIKATLDGTVILANWTLQTGYTIQLQHSNNLVSVYKHNSALLKKPGEYVKAGEPIAIVGNSGEQTSGPHLHFELWYNGNPINPQEYIVF